MKFLVDNQLPQALARLLCNLGHDAAHVIDLGLDEAEDIVLWQYAAKNDLIILTKDEDFSKMCLTRRERAAIVWIRLGNCRKKFLLDTMSRNLPLILDRLQANDQLIEIL